MHRRLKIILCKLITIIFHFNVKLFSIYKETEAILRKETKLTDDGKIPESAQNGTDVSSVLSTYKR